MALQLSRMRGSGNTASAVPSSTELDVCASTVTESTIAVISGAGDGESVRVFPTMKALARDGNVSLYVLRMLQKECEPVLVSHALSSQKIMLQGVRDLHRLVTGFEVQGSHDGSVVWTTGPPDNTGWQCFQ